jgi:SAM-dependent methyltransferase
MTDVGGREIAEVDHRHFRLLRENISQFMHRCGEVMDGRAVLVLDVAPQVHAGARPAFPKATIETLDIDQDAGATYTADLCENNSAMIPDGRFNVVVCTEVLEHTLNPFAAVQELERVLAPGGVALITVPFNFRIHGPLPDCWRFTEHGLRALLRRFEITELTALEDPDRFLMPIHYTVIARKP